MLRLLTVGLGSLPVKQEHLLIFCIHRLTFLEFKHISRDGEVQ